MTPEQRAEALRLADDLMDDCPAEPIWIYARRASDLLRALVAQADARESQAKNYATNLAIAMHAKHYPEVTQWKPLPDTLGLLTQIDNMSSGLVRPKTALDFPEQAEPVAWAQLGTLNGKTYLRMAYDRSPYPPPADVVRNLNLVPLYAHPPAIAKETP